MISAWKSAPVAALLAVGADALSMSGAGMAGLNQQRWEGLADVSELDQDDDELSRWHCGKHGMGSDHSVRSLWAPAPEQSSPGSLNLCAKDRLIPELYVLGGPKCGSTSIAIDLVGAGALCAGMKKEYNRLTKPWILDFNTSAGNKEAAREKWLAGMPPCEKGKRRVVGDYTPSAFSRVVSRLDVNKWWDTMPEASLPPTLTSLYGPLASKRLVFAVMVREPLARVHSHFYYSGASARLAGPFGQQLEQFMVSKERDLRMSVRVWYSLYGEQLDQWLTHFAPKQFVIVPTKAYAANGGMEVCGEISKRLRFKMSCAAETAHGMANPKKPHLEEDTTEEQRRKFAEIPMVAEDKKKFIRLLASGHKEGMGLPRYTGATGSEADVQQWLEKWW